MSIRVIQPAVKRALLLNASYEPIMVLSWERAIVLWFCQKVEVIEFHNYYVKSAMAQFQLPSVLKLKSYVFPKHLRQVRFSRENIYLRDNYTCQYCGEQFSTRELTLDHIIPASKSGPKSWLNVVTACRDCNQKKADKALHTVGMRLLKEPIVPKWLPNQELDPSRNAFPDNWLNYFHMKTG